MKSPTDARRSKYDGKSGDIRRGLRDDVRAEKIGGNDVPAFAPRLSSVPPDYPRGYVEASLPC